MKCYVKGLLECVALIDKKDAQHIFVGRRIIINKKYLKYENIINIEQVLQYRVLI